MDNENKALFVQRLNEALIECGGGRYNSLIEDPMIYEDDGTCEYVKRTSHMANVTMDSLAAMLGDIHRSKLIG